MQIDIVSTSSDAARATDSTSRSSRAPGKGAGSFAALLDGAAGEPTESTPAVDDEEDFADETITVPVPFIPVMLVQDPIEKPELGEMSIGEIGAEAVSSETEAIGDSTVAPGASPLTLAAGPAAGTQAGEVAGAQPGVGGAGTGFRATDKTGNEVRGDVNGAPVPGSPESGTGRDGAPGIEGAASGTTVRREEPVKQAQAPDAALLVNSTAPNAEGEAVNQPATDVQAPESAVVPNASDVPQERPAGSKSVAARFARALEQAADPAATQRAAEAAGQNNQSFDQSAGGQSSFGQRVLEELPKVAAAARASGHNSVASFATAIQQQSSLAGIAAAPDVPAMPAGALPSDQDMRQQIIQSLRMQFRDGVGEAVLKLNPEHLGSVAISLRVENGGLKASVQAEMPAVRQWLESQQDTLRNGLAEHGLRLDQFDVEPDGRRQAPDDAEEERSRKHQARKALKAEQPVFEIVV